LFFFTILEPDFSYRENNAERGCSRTRYWRESAGGK